MFDPPDYPYKDLSDSFKDYTSDDLLLSNYFATFKSLSEENGCFQPPSSENVPEDVRGPTEAAEFLVLHSDISSYESTLLDDNTVNQFFQPLEVGEDVRTSDRPTDLELLSLHSCVMCHEIFTTDADLLDHTIVAHASVPAPAATPAPPPRSPADDVLELLAAAAKEEEAAKASNNNVIDLETDWLVCTACGRVLSTAIESESNEQFCCIDSSGVSNLVKSKLHTMYVCEFCNGLFADGGHLDGHRAGCGPAEAASPALTALGHPELRLRLDCPDQPDHPDTGYSVCPDIPEPQARPQRRCYKRSESKMWNCGSCNQLFATARELYRHKRGEDRPAHAPLTAFVCAECDKVLGSMCALHTHRKMHKVSKPGYPCRVCGRRFNQSGHLAIHMRMHTGERPYPCDLCPKAFKVKVERDDHRRTHTGERPFACAACPKTFTAAARLREHARIHTDQRPYRCNICGAAFRRPYARTVHTLIHTGEKPHECDLCGTAFRRSGDMWKHKRTVHGTQHGSEDGEKTD